MQRRTLQLTAQQHLLFVVFTIPKQEKENAYLIKGMHTIEILFLADTIAGAICPSIF